MGAPSPTVATSVPSGSCRVSPLPVSPRASAGPPTGPGGGRAGSPAAPPPGRTRSPDGATAPTIPGEQAPVRPITYTFEHQPGTGRGRCRQGGRGRLRGGIPPFGGEFVRGLGGGGRAASGTVDAGALTVHRVRLGGAPRWSAGGGRAAVPASGLRRPQPPQRPHRRGRPRRPRDRLGGRRHGGDDSAHATERGAGRRPPLAGPRLRDGRGAPRTGNPFAWEEFRAELLVSSPGGRWSARKRSGRRPFRSSPGAGRRLLTARDRPDRSSVARAPRDEPTEAATAEVRSACKRRARGSAY
jgi:hypothetical protein